MQTRTFIFNQKNGSGTFTTSAFNFAEAEKNLSDEIMNVRGWRCENEDGEDE